MAEEYSFKQEICYGCGFDLTGSTSEATGLYRGVQPQGKCPGCGRSLLLDVPAVLTPEAEPEAEPELEPEAE